MKPKIAIVGAGLSGLSAGYQLMKAGFRPFIFEKESFVGGRMSSEKVDGFVIDKGAYTFPEFYQNLRKFVREAGVENFLTITPGTSSTFTGEKRYHIKIGSPTDFLGYKLLSLKNKKEMVKLFLYAQSLRKALNLGKPSEKTFELEGETATEFLLQSYSEEILEKIAYPIFCEIFLGTPENNSKLAFLATLRNLTRFKILAFEDGMGSFSEHLTEDLDVRLNSPVLNVMPVGDEGPYEMEVSGVNPGTHVVDGVILAIPLPLVLQIIDKLPEELDECFQNIPYSPSIVTALAMEGELKGTSMINNLLRTDFNTIGTVVFDHHKSPRRVPRGKTLVTAILCEKASRALFNESEERITDEVLREMQIFMPNFPSNLKFVRIYRWKYGALQLPPGRLWRLNSVRRFIEDGIQNLYFAGESSPISSLEASHMTGIRAANQVIKKMGSKDRFIQG